jgi:hypothetical protein
MHRVAAPTARPSADAPLATTFVGTERLEDIRCIGE